MMAKYPYPYLECGTHGEKRIGYVACVHVLDRGAPVRLLEQPTASRAGLVLCHLCEYRGAAQTPDGDLTTVCGKCLYERGLIPSVPFL